MYKTRDGGGKTHQNQKKTQDLLEERVLSSTGRHLISRGREGARLHSKELTGFRRDFAGESAAIKGQPGRYAKL